MSSPCQHSVHRVGRRALDSARDRRKTVGNPLIGVEWREQEMDMVWHHNGTVHEDLGSVITETVAQNHAAHTLWNHPALPGAESDEMGPVCCLKVGEVAAMKELWVVR